jgi:mannose-6-phosphate isomerase-like protein (cupin superfamily)
LTNRNSKDKVLNFKKLFTIFKQHTIFGSAIWRPDEYIPGFLFANRLQFRRKMPGNRINNEHLFINLTSVAGRGATEYRHIANASTLPASFDDRANTNFNLLLTAKTMDKKIELKATGETLTFIKSSADTNGQFVGAIVTLPANGDGPPAHRHVLQTELFEAIDGKLGLDCGGKKIIFEPGQSFTVPANTLHRFYSVEGKAIKFKVTFTPALSIEYLLTEMFEASNRKNSKDPSAFDACYILRQARGEYYLGEFPPFIQQTIFPMIAIAGKLFGFVKAKPKAAWQTT